MIVVISIIVLIAGFVLYKIVKTCGGLVGKSMNQEYDTSSDEFYLAGVNDNVDQPAGGIR